MTRLNYSKLTPSATQALYALEKTIGELGVDPVVKALVKIRASQLNGCLFCLDMHIKEARLHEERELRIHHLQAWRESSLFSAKEKAALEWTELLTKLGPHGIEDADYEKALVEFSEKELSDLSFVVATINMWNRFGVAFRQEPGALDKAFGLDKAGLR